MVSQPDASPASSKTIGAGADSIQNDLGFDHKVSERVNNQIDARMMGVLEEELPVPLINAYGYAEHNLSEVIDVSEARMLMGLDPEDIPHLPHLSLIDIDKEPLDELAAPYAPSSAVEIAENLSENCSSSSVFLAPVANSEQVVQDVIESGPCREQGHLNAWSDDDTALSKDLVSRKGINALIQRYGDVPESLDPEVRPGDRAVVVTLSNRDGASVTVPLVERRGENLTDTTTAASVLDDTYVKMLLADANQSMDMTVYELAEQRGWSLDNPEQAKKAFTEMNSYRDYARRMRDLLA